MLKVDAHQHFWRFTEEDYGWIGEEDKVLKKDFLPEQLSILLKENDMDACVAVQARQSIEETNWLIELADQYNFIKGVVGWLDLKADDLEQQLLGYKDKPCLKGFRHVLQAEPDPNFMLDPKFIRGLHILEKHGYCYDLLIFAHQLPHALKLVKQVPNLKIVIDHIAKPQIASGTGFKEWQVIMNELAEFPNVYCKVSGMVTEADLKNWQPSDFTPYLNAVFNAFGTSKVMFGSDWPVCLLGGSYSDIKNIVVDYLQPNCSDNFDDVFGTNAVKFYQL